MIQGSRTMDSTMAERVKRGVTLWPAFCVIHLEHIDTTMLYLLIGRASMKRYRYNFDLEMSITLAAIVLMIIATVSGMHHIPGGF